MKHGVTVWANGRQVILGINHITRPKFRHRNNMMNMDESIAKRPVFLAEVKAANRAPHAILGDAQVTVDGTPLVLVHDDREPIAIRMLCHRHRLRGLAHNVHHVTDITIKRLTDPRHQISRHELTMCQLRECRRRCANGKAKIGLRHVFVDQKLPQFLV